MWLSKLAPLILLAACGYTPALAPGGGGRALIGEVELAEPVDAQGFELTRELENRLGASASGTFRLETTLKSEVLEVGLTSSQEITRYNVKATASYSLTRLADGSIASSGQVTNTVSYSATGTAVSTRAAEQDAYRRLMVILADEIALRLFADSRRFAP